MLGNEIVVAVTLDEYRGKHVTCEVKQNWKKLKKVLKKFYKNLKQF